MSKILLLFIALMMFRSTISFAEQIAVIVNKSVKVNELSTKKILDIFSHRTLKWDDSSNIKIINFKGNNDIVERFYNSLGSSYIEVKKSWLRLQFAGTFVYMEFYNNEEEIIKRVASTPGAIGFVRMEKANRKVKILATL